MFNRPVVVASPDQNTQTATSELPEQLHMKLRTPYQPYAYVSQFKKRVH